MWLHETSVEHQRVKLAVLAAEPHAQLGEKTGREWGNRVSMSAPLATPQSLCLGRARLVEVPPMVAD